MDTHGKFWAVIWSLATVVGLGLTVSYTICNENDNQTMLNMVKAGANPLDAHCAVLGNGGSESFSCNILLSKKQ